MGGQKTSAVLRMRMLYAATLLARVAGGASCWLSGAEVILGSIKAAGAKAFCTRFRKEWQPSTEPVEVDPGPRALAFVGLFGSRFGLALGLGHRGGARCS